MLPLLEIIYAGKTPHTNSVNDDDYTNAVTPLNLRRFRINDKNILFTNNSKRFMLYLRDSFDNAGIYVRKLCETAVRNIVREHSKTKKT